MLNGNVNTLYNVMSINVFKKPLPRFLPYTVVLDSKEMSPVDIFVTRPDMSVRPTGPELYAGQVGYDRVKISRNIGGSGRVGSGPVGSGSTQF